MKIVVNNKTEDFNGYRSARVKSLFNAERGNEFNLVADLPIEDLDWGIGLIVGPSGSGKTSIGKNLFGGGKIIDLYEGWPKDKPIVEAINPGGDFDSVTAALANVGLGDVPAWLRPFNALSNGQQFRAGLARVMCDADDNIIIDEFTSVVDRQIAKIGAMAFSKGWRRNKGKRVVLLACHYDIVEWLQPDWVFDTGTGELKKKAILGQGQASSWKLGRSTSLTGSILSHITI
jgi:ABC-type dipeptide/oligopeptide/nickel transport system ATPase subunit